jgi:hypothetical protein
VSRLGQAGQGEDGQRAGRILELEIAVRDLSSRNRIAVALVDGRVDQLLVLVEADVQQRPRDDEERDRHERRGDDGALRRLRAAARDH